MAIQNFFTSRDNNLDGNTNVGQLGRLWYNPDTNSIYASDGVTAGGIPVDLATGANAAFNNITVNTIGTDDSTAIQFITDATFDQGATIDVGLTVTGNITVTGSISPAAAGKIGGIQPGPGVDISNQGVLTIDTANLPLSFGDFTANNNILTIVNVDEDMILATQGSAEIQLVGNVGFYKEGATPPDPADRFFFAEEDGQITIFVPAEDPITGGLEIIGSSTGNFIAPGQPGTMLQLTGNPGIPTRFYMDGNDEFSSLVARRFNGNVAVPTQVLANQDVFRINATAATDAGVGNVAMAQIQMRALENQTTTAQGSTINFLVTPIGSAATARVEVANLTVANGVTATKFTTAGTVTATGNITGGNILTGGLISATSTITSAANVAGGNITTAGLVTATGNITGGNITTAGLVTATGNVATANTFVGNLSGLVTHRVFNAGTIADAGTLTIDFSTEDLVYCVWNNGLTIAANNFTAGRVVRVMATKGTGSGVDSITFSGFTAAHTSTGSLTQSYQSDITAILEFISTDTTIGGVYIKL